MGEVHYMISEAAKRVGVETHVLRYWEEELELAIGRTEMGHRYYTNEDIRLFTCIKELKEQGMLLRNLKNLIPDILLTKKKLHMKKAAASKPDENLQSEFLAKAISQAVSEAVISDMKLLFHSQEQQEEERFRKLDTLIRQQQVLRKESAGNTALGKLRKAFQLQGI